MALHRSPNERAELLHASHQQHNENEHDIPEDGADLFAPLETDSLESLQAFFSIFCSRWALVVLAALAPSEMGCAFQTSIEYSKPCALRRHELEKRLPHVSKKVLTQTLRRLEDAGLVQCRKFAEVPTRVEYSITPQGQKFLMPLRALYNWCGQNQDAMTQALKRLPE